MLLVSDMKCCAKIPCPLPHNHYCCSFPSPICLPHLLMCTCLISSSIACPPSSALCWCLLFFFLFLWYVTFLYDSILAYLWTYFLFRSSFPLIPNSVWYMIVFWFFIFHLIVYKFSEIICFVLSTLIIHYCNLPYSFVTLFMNWELYLLLWQSHLFIFRLSVNVTISHVIHVNHNNNICAIVAFHFLIRKWL